MTRGTDLTSLTDSAIAAAVASASNIRREIADKHEPGLRLRIGPKNTTWCVATTGPGGQKLRVSIGAWPHLDVGAARSYARAVKASLQPVPAVDAETFTLESLVAIYAKRRLGQLRKGMHMERSIRAAMSGYLQFEPGAVTKRHVAEAIDTIADRAPIYANRSLAYLKAFFAWSVGRGYLDQNPAAGVAKPTRERSRDRTPTLEELVEIWIAAGDIGYPFGTAIRVLMLTAARRDEVGGMRLDETVLPGEGGAGVWVLPADRSKNGQSIRTPLAGLATKTLQLAAASSPRGSPYLFSTLGDRPVSGWSRAKRRLDSKIAARRTKAKLPPMPPWRLHDLRRAFATQACDLLQIDAAVADRCLNHVGSSTTSTIARVYGRSEMFEKRRDALTRWADLIETAVATP